jgi:hypothetical protein
MSNPQPIETAQSPVQGGSWPALLRAAARARQIAAETGTALVVMRDGKLEHVYPQKSEPRPLEAYSHARVAEFDAAEAELAAATRPPATAPGPNR